MRAQTLCLLIEIRWWPLTSGCWSSAWMSQTPADEDVALLGAYAERWFAADEAGTARPRPTPGEQEAFARLEDHRRRALREG